MTTPVGPSCEKAIWTGPQDRRKSLSNHKSDDTRRDIRFTHFTHANMVSQAHQIFTKWMQGIFQIRLRRFFSAGGRFKRRSRVHARGHGEKWRAPAQS